MLRKISGLSLFSCVLCLFMAPASRGDFILDPTTQVLTDTTAGKMWLMHGIGFASSYPYPTFANTWIENLNALKYAGFDDWRLPTVDGSSNPPPAESGELGELFANLSSVYPDRADWPFGLGSWDYGGNIIYTSTGANPGNYWGLSFGNGTYVQIYTGNAYAYVGTMAVRAVPEASSTILLLASIGAFGPFIFRSARKNRRAAC
ncbi:MAG: hypothetical protein U1D30_14170 [Planctomycetota bacterium]